LTGEVSRSDEMGSEGSKAKGGQYPSADTAAGPPAESLRPTGTGADPREAPDPREQDPREGAASEREEGQVEPTPVPITPVPSSEIRSLHTTLESVEGQIRSEYLADRRKGAHELATALSLSNEKAGLANEAKEYLLVHPVLPALMAMAVSAEAGKYDTLSVQLVLSCVTNLSYIGLTAKMIEEDPALTAFIVRTLHASVDSPALLAYSMPAAYNLSSESGLLDALQTGGVTDLLQEVAKSADPLASRYAKHTMSNLRKHRAATRALLASQQPKKSKRSWFGGGSKKPSKAGENKENAAHKPKRSKGLQTKRVDRKSAQSAYPAMEEATGASVTADDGQQSRL